MRKKTKIITGISAVVLLLLTISAILGNRGDRPKTYPANPDYFMLQEKSDALRFCMFEIENLPNSKLGLAVRINGVVQIIDLKETVKIKTGEEISTFNSIRTLLPLLDKEESMIREIMQDAANGNPDIILIDENEISLLAPFERPDKLVDMGLYPMHDRNMKRAHLKKLLPPFIYHSTIQIHNFLTKDGYFYNADYKDHLFHFVGNRIGIYGPYDKDVKIPNGYTEIDIEPELAIVISRDGKNISEENASDYIAGFCLYNDYSQRDIQADELMHSRLGFTKSKTVNAMGPYLVTELELDKVSVIVKINDVEVLTCSNDDLRWSLKEVVAYASSLEEGIIAGEIIGLGTMSGGSLFEMELPMLKAGDSVEILANQGLGTIKNSIVQ